jgi:hypothetical protein
MTLLMGSILGSIDERPRVRPLGRSQFSPRIVRPDRPATLEEIAAIRAERAARKAANFAKQHPDLAAKQSGPTDLPR